jgi:hypothetical protein
MNILIGLALWAVIGWKIYKTYRKYNPKPQPQPQNSVPVVEQTQVQPLPANLDAMTPRVETPMTPSDKRITNVQKSLERLIGETASEVGAFTYYLPCCDARQTAQFKRGIPYLVSFATKTGLRCFLFENCQNSDTVRRLKEVYLLNEACVPVEEKKADVSEETPKATIEEISKEWWVKYWPKLEGEISFVNGRKEITLDGKYRIPSADIFPFVKQYLETATKGSYTFDSINDDLIGLAIPVMKEEDEEVPEVPAE